MSLSRHRSKSTSPPRSPRNNGRQEFTDFSTPQLPTRPRSSMGGGGGERGGVAIGEMFNPSASMEGKAGGYYEDDEDLSNNKNKKTAKEKGMNVYVRFRPLSPQEMARRDRECISIEDNQVFVQAEGGNRHVFAFDGVYSQYVSQIDVYEDVAKKILDRFLQGFNGAIIAYGQTGGGKTHTMLGPSLDLPNFESAAADSWGICPRLSEELFLVLNKKGRGGVRSEVRVSFLEIYNEKVGDLLDPGSGGGGVGGAGGGGEMQRERKIRQDSERGLWVSGATEVPVSSVTEVMQLIRAGNRRRFTSATVMNEKSSRSHAIFLLTLIQVDEHKTRTSQLYLVDLAGSEKVSKTDATGDRLNEAKYINKSLLALGQVIFALASPTPQHIPYRDSKLTRLLQNSFGGQSFTSIILNCSPAEYNMLETISTLRFGDRANKVVNIPTINEQENLTELKKQLNESKNVIFRQHCVIRGLEREIARMKENARKLQAELLGGGLGGGSFSAGVRSLNLERRYPILFPNTQLRAAKFSDLYTALKLLVFSLLPARVVTLCMSVNSEWNKLGGKNAIWKKLVIANFPRVNVAEIEGGGGGGGGGGEKRGGEEENGGGGGGGERREGGGEGGEGEEKEEEEQILAYVVDSRENRVEEGVWRRKYIECAKQDLERWRAIEAVKNNEQPISIRPKDTVYLIATPRRR